MSATIRWTCKQCGVRFARGKCHNREVSFCTRLCQYTWMRLHKSESAAHLVASIPSNKKPVGAVSLRISNGVARAWVKLSTGRWRPRAIVNFEAKYGSLGSGMVVHHIDRNCLNDDFNNLEALTRADHAREHAKDGR